jgi:hypothetical protein
MRKPLICIVLSVFLLSCSEKELIVGEWTNGIVVYSSHKEPDGLVVFQGVSLHEGGYAFTLKHNEQGGFYEIIGALSDQRDFPAFGKIGYSVFVENIDGKYVLILRDEQGAIKGLLRPLAKNENLRELRIRNKVNSELAGRFIDNSTGKEIIFHTNKLIAEGLNDVKKFEFVFELNIPINVIVIPGSTYYYYEKTAAGLNIFNAFTGEYDIWEQGDLVHSLRRVEWYNPFDDKGLKGRYPFASTEILIDDIILGYSNEELRIIRNEIFARHGYIFKSADLKTHFENQEWYNPQVADVSNLLSDLEKLNIELLMRAEKGLD